MKKIKNVFISFHFVYLLFLTHLFRKTCNILFLPLNSSVKLCYKRFSNVIIIITGYTVSGLYKECNLLIYRVTLYFLCHPFFNDLLIKFILAHMSIYRRRKSKSTSHQKNLNRVFDWLWFVKLSNLSLPIFANKNNSFVSIIHNVSIYVWSTCYVIKFFLPLL